jgi:hypothetical protein
LTTLGAGNACVPGTLPSLDEIKKLRSLAEMIKNNDTVKAKLCERVDRNMDLIEGLSKELTLVRTRLSNSMMVTYNSIYSEKLTSLKAPEVIGKAVKECSSNAKEEIKADEYRYKTWECEKTPTETRCASLRALIEETKGDTKECEDKGRVVLARDEDQYIATRSALRESKKRMDRAMSEFMRADCEKSNKEPYCQGKDGNVAKVKEAYNSSLTKMKSSQCPTLQAPRFAMAKDVYRGNLPATQDGLTPQAVVNGAPVNTDSDRLPALTEPTNSEPTIFMRGWNAFMNSMKSLFSWFGK